MTTQDTFKIVNKAGLAARAATRFVQTANRFRCRVTVHRDAMEVDGKSIMGVLGLVAGQGQDITIVCDGADAAPCLAALGDLVKSGFDED
jgi:phosphocarrier protein HPr